MTLLAGIPMAINTNGLEWRREKWSWALKLYYCISTYVIAKLCNGLVSDSIEIRNFYKDRFNATSHCIPYGVHPPAPITEQRAKDILDSFGLEEGRFFIQVTRMEPDNLPYEAGVAFQRSGLAEQGYKMVIVGYKDKHPYARKLKSLDGKRGVIIVDATHDRDVLAALRTRCASYIHGNHVGSTNPALLEAMISCPRIMAIDINFRREVLGETEIYFDDSNCSETFHKVLVLEDRSKMMRERIANYYRWDETAESYMRVAEGQSANYSLCQEL